MFTNRQFKSSSQLLPLGDGGWLRYSKRYAALCISYPNAPSKSSIHPFPEYLAITVDNTVPQSRRLICAHSNNLVKIWDFDSQKKKFVCLRTLQTSHTSPITSIASISTNEFASGHEDGTILFWDKAKNASKSKPIPTSLSQILFLIYSKSENLLVANDGHEKLFFYNKSDKTTTTHYAKTKTRLNVCTLLMSPNNNRLVLAAENQLLIVNIAQLGNISERTMSFPKMITGKLLTATIRADGYIMTGHNDGSIVTTDPINFAIVNTQSTGKHPVFALQQLVSGTVVYTTPISTFTCLTESPEARKYLEEQQKLTKQTASLFPLCMPDALIDLTLQYAKPQPRLEMTMTP